MCSVALRTVGERDRGHMAGNNHALVREVSYVLEPPLHLELEIVDKFGSLRTINLVFLAPGYLARGPFGGIFSRLFPSCKGPVDAVGSPLKSHTVSGSSRP